MACDNNCKIRLEKGIISCFIGRSVVRRVCNCTAGLKLPRGWDLGLFLLFFFFFPQSIPWIILFCCLFAPISCEADQSLPVQHNAWGVEALWGEFIQLIYFDVCHLTGPRQGLCGGGWECSTAIYTAPRLGEALQGVKRVWSQSIGNVRHPWALLPAAGKDFGMFTEFSAVAEQGKIHSEGVLGTARWALSPLRGVEV